MSKIFLFVYGTLKQGDCRNGVLKGSRFIGPAQTSTDYTLFNVGGSFPAMVRAPAPEQASGVEGELYEVDSSLLDRRLDAIECVPTMYNRATVPISVKTDDPEDAKITEATAYLWQKSLKGLPHLGHKW